MPSPVILLAFANERTGGSQYLRNLPQEQHLIRKSLEKAEDNGLCEVVVLPNATLDQLVETFQRQKYRDRIAVFHYGGHAGSFKLLLEDAEGKTRPAHAEGLIPFLARQRGLKLVFINGCHSGDQAQALTDGGIPAVIGTSNAIDDEVATELAAGFYRSLGEGMPLENAWQETVFRIKAGQGSGNLSRFYHKGPAAGASRSVVALDLNAAYDQFPWRLHVRPGAEAIRDWNLPAEADDPYFGLPAIPPNYNLPEEPYRFLGRYTNADAGIFFGRGTYIRDIYHQLHSPHASPVLLLYGQSGVGKSSLLEAGLFPRLESEFDLRLARRNPAVGLLGQLCEALGLPAAETDAGALLSRWQQLEGNAPKKGLLIAVDQVEEVYTRPRDRDPDELANFLTCVGRIFAHPADRPKGKLLLSYRKEYHPEIDKACRAAAVPRDAVFLDRLDRQGLIEIVNGLTSTPALRHKYRLRIEEGLPVLIADDLLVDKNSPISPILQIILTRLWQEEAEKDERYFNCDAYNELRKKGVLLDDFFQQQMAELHRWEEEVQQAAESSGLALDMLQCHTTSLGTAESRNLDELRALYQHQGDRLEMLIRQLNGLYLLTAVGQDRSSLAHDTLAPVVQKEHNESDRPGQRASRILASKMMDFERQPDRTYIDEEDLRLVEEGAGGMRIWTGKEQELIEKSRQRRARLQAERKRNRRLKMGFVALITVLAVTASFLWWRSSVQASVNQLISEALRQKETDATEALKKIQLAWEKIRKAPFSLDRSLALQTRRDIYEQNEFYRHAYSLDTAVTAVDLSGDASLLLAAAGNQVFLWDTAGRPTQLFPLKGAINAVAFSPDEQLILVACRDSTIGLWDRKGNIKTLMKERTGRVNLALFSPGGDTILSATNRGRVILRNLNGDTLKSWAAHSPGEVTAAVFFPKGDTIVTGGTDRTVNLWDKSGRKINAFPQDNGIVALAASPLGGRFLVATLDTVRLLNTDGRQILAFKPHEKRITDVAFSPDSQSFFTAGMDGQVRSWDLKGNLIKTYRGHADFVRALKLSADGRNFITAGEDGQVKWWEKDSKVARQFGPHKAAVTAIAISPDGQYVLTGVGGELAEIEANSGDAAYEELMYEEAYDASIPVYLWQIDGRRLRVLTGHADEITALAFAPDSREFLTASRDYQAIIWRENDSIVLPHNGEVYAVAYAPDGRMIATGGNDRNAYLWSRSGVLLDTISHPELVSSLAFSPDGSLLLTGCFDGFARLWQLADPPVCRDSFASRKPDLTCVAFSPDGRHLAFGEGDSDAIVTVCDTKGKTCHTIRLPEFNPAGQKRVNSLAFSPDGKYIAAGLEGGSVRLLDLSGEELLIIRESGEKGVTGVSFSRDGKLILAGSMDGMARLLKNIID